MISNTNVELLGGFTCITSSIFEIVFGYIKEIFGVTNGVPVCPGKNIPF
jgi:hypothetical protein